MPWFPDFASAVELARRQTRAAGQADPVREYFTVLNTGDTRVLETVWPGEVVIYDPRAGEIRGHRRVRQFVGGNLSWLAGHHARTETVASTVDGGRAVVELVAQLAVDGQELAWPVAVVAESPDDRSVVFRTYCSQWPVRCALEYNCLRWGSHDLPPQAGLSVYERGRDGLLTAARVYDDIRSPAGSPGSGWQ